MSGNICGCPSLAWAGEKLVPLRGGQGCFKHLTMHRTALRAKNDLAQNVNCAEADKSALHVLCEMISKTECNKGKKGIEKMLRKNRTHNTNA